jgi:hypothetical protein
MFDEFQPGDYVTFTNDNGVVFEGKRIVRRDNHWTGIDQTPRYFIEPTDAPWFSTKVTNLSRVSRPLTQAERYASNPSYGRF